MAEMDFLVRRSRSEKEAGLPMLRSNMVRARPKGIISGSSRLLILAVTQAASRIISKNKTEREKVTGTVARATEIPVISNQLPVLDWVVKYFSTRAETRRKPARALG